MTLNQFAFFAAVAKHLNLTKASRELRVSQPSISQQLRLLEQNYGFKLYRRIQKGIELTEVGRLFLRKIVPILEQVDQLKTTFSALKVRLEPDTLRVGGTFSPSTLLLPALSARFKKIHPEIEIDLRTGSAVQLEQLLLSARVEIGVSTHRPRHPELTWEPLRNEKLVLFVSCAHPLARESKVTLSQVQQFPLVIRYLRGTHGTTEKLLNQFAEQGLEFKVGMRCDTPYAIKEAVKENAGIGIVFEDVLKHEVKHGDFKILQGHGLKLEADTYILYRNDSPLSLFAQEFLELLRGVRAKSHRTEVLTTQPQSYGKRKGGRVHLGEFLSYSAFTISTLSC